MFISDNDDDGAYDDDADIDGVIKPIING